MEARTYAVINIEDLKLIDFSQIEETSSNTIRKSLDESQFIIKWEKQEPTFIADGSVKPLQVLSHAECLELMATSDWSKPLELEVKEKK